MRLPRLRFTIRRMMVAVAIVGAVIGAEVMRRRSAYFRERAHWHQNQVRVTRAVMAPLLRAYADKFAAEAAKCNSEAQDCPDRDSRQALENKGQSRGASAKKYARQADSYLADEDMHFRLSRRYTRVARYPWLPVSPDPPAPD